MFVICPLNIPPPIATIVINGSLFIDPYIPPIPYNAVTFFTLSIRIYTAVLLILPGNNDILLEKGVEVHYLGYYLKWDPQECYYYAVENTGFSSNTERTEGSYSKYSSIDDKIDPFHYFTTLIKFGIGRATYDASQEIRNGKITRDEGINLVTKFDQEFPNKYFNEFLNYIDTSENEFWETIDKFRSPHLWEKINDKWNLRNIIK